MSVFKLISMNVGKLRYALALIVLIIPKLHVVPAKVMKILRIQTNFLRVVMIVVVSVLYPGSSLFLRFFLILMNHIFENVFVLIFQRKVLAHFDLHLFSCLIFTNTRILNVKSFNLIFRHFVLSADEGKQCIQCVLLPTSCDIIIESYCK